MINTVVYALVRGYSNNCVRIESIGEARALPTMGAGAHMLLMSRAWAITTLLSPTNLEREEKSGCMLAMAYGK